MIDISNREYIGPPNCYQKNSHKEQQKLFAAWLPLIHNGHKFKLNEAIEMLTVRMFAYVVATHLRFIW